MDGKTDDTDKLPVQRQEGLTQAQSLWLLMGLATVLLVIVSAGLMVSARQPAAIEVEPPLALAVPSLSADTHLASVAKLQEPVTPDPVVFSVSPERPARTPLLLPSEASQIYCFFELSGMPKGQVTGRWSLEGDDLGPLPAPQQLSRAGDTVTGHFVLTPPSEGKPFADGIYVVELLVGGKPVYQASFVAAEEAEKILAAEPLPAGELVVSDVMTATGMDAEGWPVALAGEFRPSDRIWVWFRYANGIPGGALEVKWLCRDMLIGQATTQVRMVAETGWGQAWIEPQEGQLPPGPYEVRITLAGDAKALGSAKFAVLAEGEEPTVRPAPAKPEAEATEQPPVAKPVAPALTKAPLTPRHHERWRGKRPAGGGLQPLAPEQQPD